MGFIRNNNKKCTHPSKQPDACSLCSEEENKLFPIIKDKVYKETVESVEAYNQAATSLNKQEQKRQRKNIFGARLRSTLTSHPAFTVFWSCLAIVFLVINIYLFTGNINFATRHATEVWTFFNSGEVGNLTKTLIAIYNMSTVNGTQANNVSNATINPKLSTINSDVINSVQYGHNLKNASTVDKYNGTTVTTTFGNFAVDKYNSNTTTGKELLEEDDDYSEEEYYYNGDEEGISQNYFDNRPQGNEN